MEYKHYEMTWTRTEAMIQNQNILHENRLPARVNLVPAQKAGIYEMARMPVTSVVG